MLARMQRAPHFVLALGLLALVGCAGSASDGATTGCSDGSDCATAEACEDGVCAPSTCRSDDDCPFRFFCNGGICDEVPDYCARNGDCPAGHLCDGETQRCIPAADIERDCSSRQDCFAGEECLDGICGLPDASDTGSDARDAEPDGDPDTDLNLDPDTPDVDPPDADPDIPDSDVDTHVPDTNDATADAPDMYDAPDFPDAPDLQDVPEDLPTDVPDDLSEDVPEDLPMDVPEDLPPDVPDAEPDVPQGPYDRGVYRYTALRAVGQGVGRVARFHPSGDYALYAENYDIIHRFDWATQEVTTLDVGPAQGFYRFTDLEFSPSGDYALLTGYRTQNNVEYEGVLFLWQDETWTQLEDATRDQPFEAIAFPNNGGLPVILARHDNRASPVTLRWLDVDTGDFTQTVVSEFASAGCTDVAHVEDEFGDPALLVSCGINGADVLLWNGAWRHGQDMGNNNLGNTHHVTAHPSGAYAYLVSDSGRAMYRYRRGLIEPYGDAARFSRHAVWGMVFQQGGGRALVFGQAGRTPLTGTMIEYRHELDACPVAFTNCDWTDVSIDNFDDAPWLGQSATSINDVAWRPGCDGGLLVGGRSNFQGSYPLLGEFQLENGRACR